MILDGSKCCGWLSKLIKKRCDRRSHLFFLQPLDKLDARQLAGLAGFLFLSGLFAPCVKLFLRGAACADAGETLLVLAAVLPKQLVLIMLDRPHPHCAGLLAGTSAVE